MYVLECSCDSREFKYAQGYVDGFICRHCGKFIKEENAGHYLIREDNQ